ncbi:hypothetical protein M514_14822 [Trichuris suis]|uniref:ISXO2-like transposase domain-containing protein n=1 Tax=Trichuris suis TaxID=68888 RepID=A0A085NTX2_9BILA|nr:hypothetical protein M514_14822 [Trichuris suis]
MKLTVERNGKAPRWRRCRKAECKTEVSLRTGTWFEGLKLDFRTAVLFIYSWSNDYCSTKFCSKELGLSTNCSVSWKRLLREVAAESLLSNPLVIGGPNCTVEVDETLYADEDTAIRFLQEKGILHQQRLCTRGHAMKLTVERNGKAPRWRCRKAECKTEVSLRTGTWFEGLKLDFRTAVLFIYSWSNDYWSTKFCSKEAEHELFSLMEEAIARGGR